jgi:hypothetical protein
MIRCALLNPRFLILLDIAVRFGVERLMKEWAVLCEGLQGEREFSRVQSSTQRMLNHVMEGALRASPTTKALWERLRLEPLLRGFV